jgi:hypothetical protein
MKRKAFVLVLLVIALVFTGCDNGTTSGGNTDPKSVTIENINSSDLNGTNTAGIFIFATMPDEDHFQPVAVGYGTISGTSLSVDLTIPFDDTYEDPQNPWRGYGDYFVGIFPVKSSQIQEDDALVFTNGGGEPVKAAFNAALITLDCDDFIAASD